mmetsp:Transcript_20409/g.49640  ORF Transcript_20409/g.49640 Transcript_20409/m.49640 type:complete len:263 (-) Transcript_20409:153-941(-)
MQRCSDVSSNWSQPSLRTNLLDDGRCNKFRPPAQQPAQEGIAQATDCPPFTNVATGAADNATSDRPPTYKDNGASRLQQSRTTSSHLMRRQSTFMTAALSFISTEPALARTVNLQSALASLEVSPCYLRTLSDQIRLYSLIEVTGLLYTNLTLLITNQIMGTASSLAFVQGIGGLLMLVSIECAFEAVLFLVMVRWNNFPLLSSSYKKDVTCCEFLTCLWMGIRVASLMLPYLEVFVLRMVDADKGGEVQPADMCPYFSFIF